MKPYGRKPKHHNYQDNHPPKGYVNWWEKDLENKYNKKSARQQSKKVIMEELTEGNSQTLSKSVLGEKSHEGSSPSSSAIYTNNRKANLLLEGKTIISKEPGNSMTPILKSRQPVKLAPTTWEDVEVGDIVYCRVRGRFYTHLVTAKSDKKGCKISNNHGHDNGWTKQVFGKVIEILD